jgi:hypothetical protein
MNAVSESRPQALDLEAAFRESHVAEVLDKLGSELVGLTPVKSRIRDICALLLVETLRRRVGLSTQAPSLHMSFTGNPGTGKTTVAWRMAEILHRLGYVVRVTWSQSRATIWWGSTSATRQPKTREVIKRAMGGVLFIDEAYYLHRPQKRARLWAGSDRNPAAGDGEPSRRPGRHRRRLQRPDGDVSAQQTPACPRAWRTTSTFRTTAPWSFSKLRT